MSLRKAASLGMVQAVVTMAAAFASVKITSVFLGPAGTGLLSQFQYVMTIALGLAAGSTNTGVVRMAAQYAGDPERLRLLVGTVSRILLAVGIALSVAMVVLSPWIATDILKDSDWAPAIILFAVTYTGGLVHALLKALANAAKDYRAVTMMNITAVLITLALFVALCPPFGLAGALVAAGLGPAISAGVSMWWARGRSWRPVRPFHSGFSREEMRKFLSFVPMTIAFALLPPASQILIRDLLAAGHGWEPVGFVQGMTRLSDMYLNVIITVLSMYYLPRFAEVRLAPELRRELVRAVAIILPSVVAISAILYFARELVIWIIYTPEFLPMTELFGWQMVANVLRMMAWLFGFVLVARAVPTRMVIYEFVQSAVLLGVSWLLVPTHGAIGVVQAFAVAQCFSVVVSVTWVTLMIRRMPKTKPETVAGTDSPNEDAGVPGPAVAMPIDAAARKT